MKARLITSVELFESLVRRLRDQKVAEDRCNEAPGRKENEGAISDGRDHRRDSDTDDEVGKPADSNGKAHALCSMFVLEHFRRQRPNEGPVGETEDHGVSDYETLEGYSTQGRA